MRFKDAMRGCRKFEAYGDELFNQGTNTEILAKDAAAGCVARHEMPDGGLAFVMPNGTEEGKFAVLYFDAVAVQNECFAYNIGYVDEMPDEADIGERVCYLEEAADKERVEAGDGQVMMP